MQMLQPPPGPPAGHGQPPANPESQHINNFNQQQPQYRQPLGPQRPVAGPPHPYGQRGYQQNQYPGQYNPQQAAPYPQGHPQAQYPPQNQPPTYPPNTQGI